MHDILLGIILAQLTGLIAQWINYLIKITLEFCNYIIGYHSFESDNYEFINGINIFLRQNPQSIVCISGGSTSVNNENEQIFFYYGSSMQITINYNHKKIKIIPLKSSWNVNIQVSGRFNFDFFCQFQKYIVELKTKDRYLTQMKGAVMFSQFVIKDSSLFFYLEPAAQSMIDYLKIFLSSKNDYEKRGLCWKTNLFMYGKPGTGKSTFIRYLSHHFGLDMFLLHYDQLSDNISRFGLINKPQLWIFEDFNNDNLIRTLKNDNSLITSIHDQNKAQNSNSPINDENDHLKNNARTNLIQNLSIQDGLLSRTNVIMIFISNEPLSFFPPVITRPGRIDKVFEFKGMDMMKKDIFNSHTQKIFPELSKAELKQIFNLFVNHKDFLQYNHLIPFINFHLQHQHQLKCKQIISCFEEFFNLKK